MFTGDSSGDFLYRALFETGFASQPESVREGDGLELQDAYITAAVRCAPPDNRPTNGEFAACRQYLEQELALLPRLKVVLVLGRLALDSYLRVLRNQGQISRLADCPFGHGKVHYLGEGLPRLLCCYHPSRQNTQTGRLTMPMLLSVLHNAKLIVTGRH
jgi:uracil-DNA glycosylase family 4